MSRFSEDSYSFARREGERGKESERGRKRDGGRVKRVRGRENFTAVLARFARTLNSVGRKGGRRERQREKRRESEVEEREKKRQGEGGKGEGRRQRERVKVQNYTVGRGGCRCVAEQSWCRERREGEESEQRDGEGGIGQGGSQELLSRFGALLKRALWSSFAVALGFGKMPSMARANSLAPSSTSIAYTRLCLRTLSPTYHVPTLYQAPPPALDCTVCLLLSTSLLSV